MQIFLRWVVDSASVEHAGVVAGLVVWLLSRAGAGLGQGQGSLDFWEGRSIRVTLRPDQTA